jgi:predicted dehydrogenase
MGNMHFGIYETNENAKVVALADADPNKLKPGESALTINIGTGAARIDPSRHKLYNNADDLISNPDVDLVDICLPTYMHPEYMIKAIKAGKHVLCEKPMALTYEECRKVLNMLRGKRTRLMIAQCIRFWPEYVYLKETVDSGRLGKVLSAYFWRGGSAPTWSWDNWFLNHKRSGGFILDLHIHDADFVHYLFGKPAAVCSSGAIGPTSGFDIVDTLYIYKKKMSVHAGANMALPPGFGFEMKYAVSFEKGCLVFSSAHSPTLTEIVGSEKKFPELKKTDGYREEIAYLVRCLEKDQRPAVAMPQSSAFSVQLIEAEIKSVKTGKVVKL